jgi:CRISPR-associated endonuclease Cas2
MNSTHIVSYDITSNKLRRKVEKELKNYGIRLQYSVFSCRISTVELQNLRSGLLDLLAVNAKYCKSTDSIIIFSHLDVHRVEFIQGEGKIFVDYAIVGGT